VLALVTRVAWSSTRVGRGLGAGVVRCLVWFSASFRYKLSKIFLALSIKGIAEVRKKKKIHPAAPCSLCRLLAGKLTPGFAHSLVVMTNVSGMLQC
jgi:hypothetical protein